MGKLIAQPETRALQSFKAAESLDCELRVATQKLKPENYLLLTSQAFFEDGYVPLDLEQFRLEQFLIHVHQ